MATSDEAKTEVKKPAPRARAQAKPAEPLAVAPVETTPASVDVQAPSTSVLGRLRANRMGPLTVGLVVAIAVGLLLAALVPDEPNLLTTVILAVLVTAAVGASVRYVSSCRGWRSQAAAFVSAALGIHLTLVTGSIAGVADNYLGDIGAAGPGFDDAILIAFAMPVVSSGAVLAGLVAAIIAGWGRRKDECR